VPKKQDVTKEIQIELISYNIKWLYSIRQGTGLCFKKDRRMYLYTGEVAVWLFIAIISNSYLDINNYTEVLSLI